MTPPLLHPEPLRELVAGLGYELVDLRVGGSASRRTVRLRIDVPGGGGPGRGVTSEDCQRVSRALEEQLEAAGAVGPQWELEVSSPGIERPIRFAQHWQRYTGRDVRFKAAGHRGARTARIVAMPDAEHVELKDGEETFTLALDQIKEATLVVDWSKLGNQAAGES